MREFPRAFVFSSLLLPFVGADYFQFCKSSYRSPIQSIAFYLEHRLSTHDPNKNMRQFMRRKEENAMQQKLHRGRTMSPFQMNMEGKSVLFILRGRTGTLCILFSIC